MGRSKRQPLGGISSEDLIVTDAHLALEREFGGPIACAEIRAVMNGEYGVDFVERVAWEMTDPEDRKKLFAAATVLEVDAVIKKIAERTGIVFQDRTVNSRLDTEEAVLQIDDGCSVVVQHNVHWPCKTDLYSMERR